jgi:hypothetical protein
MRMGICFEPALALDYAQAHACLVRMGHGDTAFDDLLRQALSAQASGSRERPPHRVLEQLWTAESCGLQSLVRSPPCDVLLSQSVLAGPPDLLSGSREDFYAFTHALMYVTDPDLSRKRLPRPQAEILSEANVLLARCLDEEDYDLAGEILLAWPAFGAPWSATATFAFRVLTYVEDEAGFLPSAGLRIERANALTGSDRANYVLATSYHTAYVMGLLCAACLRDGHSPPAEICGAAASADVRTFARATVSPDNERPHWTLVFNRLTESEQDSLAEFVMDVALQRAVRSRDLEAAMKVLTLAHENSMSDAPGWSQAAEYLLRVGALGEHPPPARPTALSR